MRENVCEIETIGSSVENLWNRLFSCDISFISEASRQLYYVAETNIMLAMLLAFCLLFLEAFIPALPYTAFVFFNVNLIGGVLVLFGKSIVEVLSNPLLLVGVVVAGIAIYYGTKYVTKRFDFYI